MTKIHDEQLNTVSQAAAKTLKTFRFMDIPNFIPISDKLILKMRRQFQAGEDKVEMGIITNHHLKIQDVKFNGVSGKLVSSPTTDFTKGVIFNVHGGGFVMGTARERNVLLAAAETSLPFIPWRTPLLPRQVPRLPWTKCPAFIRDCWKRSGNGNYLGWEAPLVQVSLPQLFLGPTNNGCGYQMGCCCLRPHLILVGMATAQCLTIGGMSCQLILPCGWLKSTFRIPIPNHQ